VNTRRTDFLVGLFILMAVGVVAGMGIVTSGLGEKRVIVYLRTASAEALTPDTRVVLGGLTIGRVREINPVVDSATGALSFVARLSLQERFPNGTELVLPHGTRGRILQTNPIQPAWIDLALPEHPAPGVRVRPGDTLASERPRSMMDALPEIAEDLRRDLRTTLDATRTLIARSTTAVEATQALLASNGPLLSDALTRLAATLERGDSLLAAVTPRIGPLADSLGLVLADTRRALSRADTVLALAGGIASDNRATVRELSDRLLRAAIVLEHFSDQVSRRPLRLLTGVRPPPGAAPGDTAPRSP
jgi:ABC-type transporter Mla subunit MlaD